MNIEKQIAVPKSNAGRPAKYPWPEMVAGDSVFIKTDDVACIRVAAHNFFKRRGLGSVTRKEAGGVRVWCK